jgi:hypothetical protein
MGSRYNINFCSIILPLELCSAWIAGPAEEADFPRRRDEEGEILK